MAAGLGVTTLPGLCLRAARHPGIRTAPLPGARRHVFAMTYGEPPDPPATARLIDVLALAAGEQAARGLTAPARPRGPRPDRYGGQIALPRPSQYGSRSRRLSSLPLGSRGSSSVKSMLLGHFIWASLPSSEARISAASAHRPARPAAGCTTALTCSPQSSSGIPNTATSATLGFMMISASISAG